ncbi:MAG: DUF779 domain-containing protein [Candidatus Competibacter sp.]|nr:DUF779 domain-containing protein [Candidatus Competibacter sp.]
MANRVDITPAAETLVGRLRGKYGKLMFHQSGGCCDGSTPMCYPRDEFMLGDADVFLGWVAGEPFYMGAAQFEFWEHTHLTLDVVEGRGAGFTLEAPEGYRFVIRSRLYTDEEWEELRHRPVPKGRQHGGER